MFLTWKNVNPIINRKNDFLCKINFFSWNKLRITLSMVNRLFVFWTFWWLFFSKIRFLKHWENAAKTCWFLLISNFLHMMFLTSISTKKNENVKFLHPIWILTYGDFDIIFNKNFFFHSLRFHTYVDFDIIFSKQWTMKIKYIRYVCSSAT